MQTWVLIMWSWAVPPFVAGEYYDRARCEASAQVQRVGLYGALGPGRLHYKCEQAKHEARGQD
jgi:hypothetical protein